MTKLSCALVFVAMSAVVSGQQAAPVQTADLRIDVAAVDRRGEPVTDLRPAEFEVWISGYRVPIAEVHAITAATTPRTVILVLDDAAVSLQMAPRVRETARAFVDAMSDGDTLSILTFHGVLANMESNRARLLAAIDGYAPQGFPLQVEDAGARVLRLMESTARRFPESRAGRKVIVGIGAGWLFDTPMPPPGLRDLQVEWVSAMRAMAATNCSLYVIDPIGMRMEGRVDSGATGFARETGGHAFLTSNDLQGAAKRVWAEAGSYYILATRNPPVQRDADLRQVEVRVLRKGVTVHARRGIKGRP